VSRDDVEGGAVGAAVVATGILSPAHAGAMIGDAVVRGTGTSARLNEATYAPFGTPGHGPNYMFFPKLKERADRGQQSLTTVMRVTVGQPTAASCAAQSFLWGDDPPFQVERLAAESFARAVATLGDPSHP